MPLARGGERQQEWVQENVSMSAQGVLRGLHFQHPNGQAKLVTVLEGEIFDVTLDVRHGSPSFGQAAVFALRADGDNQLHIPEGFAHGFYVNSKAALVHYKCSRPWAPAAEKIVFWNDPSLGIKWPLDGKPVVSEKDTAGRFLESFSADELPLYSDRQ